MQIVGALFIEIRELSQPREKVAIPSLSENGRVLFPNSPFLLARVCYFAYGMYLSECYEEDCECDPASETWVRPPKNGERLEALSKASIYAILDNPESRVISVCLKANPKAQRGCRLIGLKSLRAYLSRLAAEQNTRL